MAKNYDVWFCKCGHIHFIPFDTFEWIKEDYINRRVIQVCQSCNSVRETTLDPYEDGFCVCRNDVESFEIRKDPNANEKFFTDKGVAVFLKNFDGASIPAVNKIGNRWFGLDSKGNRGFNPVDTLKLIQDIERNYKDDADDILRAISGYVSGIDWSNTEYELNY